MKRVISLKIYLKWRSSCLLAEIRKHHHRELIVFIIFQNQLSLITLWSSTSKWKDQGFALQSMLWAICRSVWWHATVPFRASTEPSGKRPLSSWHQVWPLTQGFIASICSEIFTEMHGQWPVSLCKNIGGGHIGFM